jgi:sialate O-acetylesterase
VELSAEQLRAPSLDEFKKAWQTVRVPGTWAEVSRGTLGRYDGFGWYRCFVNVPADWKGKGLTLTLGLIDDCDETFVNGHKVGASGSMPPAKVATASETPRSYSVPADAVRPGQWNLIAIRVYDRGGRAGFKSTGQALTLGEQKVDLRGNWLLRIGDDPNWARQPKEPTSPDKATFPAPRKK